MRPGEGIHCKGSGLLTKVSSAGQTRRGCLVTPTKALSFLKARSQKRKGFPKSHQDANPILWTGVMQLASPGTGRSAAWTSPTWVGEPTSFLSQKRWKAGKPSITQEGHGVLLCSHADSPQTAGALTHRTSWKITASWSRKTN